MANLICAKCNKTIEEKNLVECPFCWEMYHKECWEETKFCLSCKKYNLDFARVQEEKEEAEQKAEQEEKIKVEEIQEEEENEEQLFQMPTKEINHSPIANTIMLVSRIALIIGLIAGVAVAANGIIDAASFAGKVVGVVLGCVVASLGWVSSVLINGFADLINNSQKTAYYLSKLVDKDEKKGMDE
ncbi:MAG: hypothetical protein IKV25_07150 [Clostridia bacterium]|nr:hypothetical protein [Clostridia bacterium]